MRRFAHVAVTVLLAVSAYPQRSVLAAGVGTGTRREDAERALLAFLPASNSGTRISRLTRWAVVDGAPIVRATGGVSAELAATASVLAHLNDGLGARGPLFRADPDVVAALSRELAVVRGGETQRTAVMGAYERMVTGLQSQFREPMQSGTPGRSSYGAGLCELLGRAGQSGMVRSSSDAEVMARAVSDFLCSRLYEPVVRVEDADYEVCRVLVDNRLTFAVFGAHPGDASVCLGYAEADQDRYWVLGDPSRVPQQEQGRAEMVLGQGDMADRLREANRGLDAQFGRMVVDYRFSLSTAASTHGIRAVPWQAGCSFLVVCRPRPSPDLISRFRIANSEGNSKE